MCRVLHSLVLSVSVCLSVCQSVCTEFPRILDKNTATEFACIVFYVEILERSYSKFAALSRILGSFSVTSLCAVFFLEGVLVGFVTLELP